MVRNSRQAALLADVDVGGTTASSQLSMSDCWSHHVEQSAYATGWPVSVRTIRRAVIFAIAVALWKGNHGASDKRRAIGNKTREIADSQVRAPLSAGDLSDGWGKLRHRLPPSAQGGRRDQRVCPTTGRQFGANQLDHPCCLDEEIGCALDRDPMWMTVPGAQNPSVDGRRLVG